MSKLKIQEKLADFISSKIASFTFVSFYTLTMIGWITLHAYGVLNLDSSDFMKYNLFLSWFAGTQASIIMISQNRQANKDRKTLNNGVRLDQEILNLDTETNQKIKSLITKVSQLEEVLTYVIEEDTDEES